MRSFSLAIAMAIISAAAAAPTADATVPELSLVQSLNAKAAADAKNTVQQMLETGSDSSACKDLAGSILTEVEDNIKSQEELLSNMPDGSACKSEGQGVVDAAQAAIDSAQTMKSSADAAAATAASAPVDFGTYSLSSISTTSCTQFESDPVYTAAVATSQQAQNAATTAAAELTAAQNELTSAQDAQAKAIKTCECAAFTAYDTAYKQANTRSDEDLSAWKKGKHMQCVLAGTDASACDVGSPPEVTKRTLAAGVDQSACAPVKVELGCAAVNGYQLPGETLPQGYGWYGSPRLGMSCNQLCASCGKTFDAPHTVQTGNKACNFFHPDFPPYPNWEAVGTACVENGHNYCHGANGQMPNGAWQHQVCMVQCVCKA